MLPFPFQLLTKHIGDNPSGDVTISSSTLPEFCLLFFSNVFNLNFHVLNLNFQPFVCLCCSPQHPFPHSTKLVLVHVTAASSGAAHPQPTPPLFKIPPSGHPQHIFQHSQSPAFFLPADPLYFGLFLAGGIRSPLSEFISNLAALAVVQILCCHIFL